MQESPRWLIFRCGLEIRNHDRETTPQRFLGKMRQHSMLHPAPQHAATQQQGIDLERFLGSAEEDRARQSIVAETVRYIHRQALQASIREKGADLSRGAPNGCEIKLIGALGQLSHAAKLGGTACLDCYAKFQRLHEVFQIRSLL